MSMQNDKHRFCAFLLITSTLAACGGGGGSSDGGGITYTGNTSPALIDESNAKELALNSYGESEAGSILTSPLSPVVTQASLTDRHITGSRLQSVLDTLEAALSATKGVDELTALHVDTYQMRAAAMESGTEHGSCGGSASYSMDADENTGSFSGAFTFTNYCDEGVKLNGAMSISGFADDTQGIHLEIRFDSLQTEEGSESAVMDGSITMKMNGSQTEFTMNLLAQDGTTNEIYKIENLVITEIDQEEYSESTIRGRFYDPVEGYVNITTPLPFKTNYFTYDYPTEGMMRIEGANSTYATLTANSDGATCFIEVDTNGDGTIDYSETVRWDDA